MPDPEAKEPSMADLQELFAKEKAEQIDEYEKAKNGQKISQYPINLPGEDCQVTNIRKMMSNAGDDTVLKEEIAPKPEKPADKKIKKQIKQRRLENMKPLVNRAESGDHVQD